MSISSTSDRPVGSAPEDGAAVELSVVMPCLNEVRTLEPCIRKALACMRENGIVGEVIIADNGSTDGSQALATRLGARVVPIPARGYGAALAGGFAAARGKYIIMGDSDDSYDFSNLMPFVEKLRQGHDLVMGNRFKGGIHDGAMPPLHRYFGNPFLTFVGRLLFKSRCGDFYCGQRGFTRAAAMKMDLQTTGMEFALEMLVKATMHGMRVTEVPIQLHPDGRDRAPHLRSWRDGWRSLRFFLLYSPRWLFLYPGLIMMLVGLLGGLWLLPGPRHVGPMTLDVHTLIYCAAAVSLGFQLVMFSLFGKMLAIVTGLHPRNPRIERLFGGTQLEIGLIVGGLLVLAGLGTSAFATIDWAETRFGNLNPFETLRAVVPAVLALTLGVQVIFSSFFMSLLHIQQKKLQPRDPASGACP